MHPQRPWAWGRYEQIRLGMLIFGIALIVCSVAMVVGPQLRKKSVAHGIGGRIAMAMAGPRPTSTGGFFPGFTVYATDDGALHLLHRGEEEAETTALAQRGATAAYNVSASDGETVLGLWGACVRARHAFVSAETSRTSPTSGAGRVTAERARDVRQVVVDAMTRTGDLLYPASRADLIAHGKWASSTHLWSGYALNAAAVIGVLLTIALPPFVASDLRRLHRARHGRCPLCAYDLRGLAPSARACPECGGPMTRLGGASESNGSLAEG